LNGKPRHCLKNRRSRLAEYRTDHPRSPFRNRIHGEKDKAYKLSGQSMDLPVRTAAGKAFSNFAVRETDSGSTVANDFGSASRLAVPIAPEFSGFFEEQRVAFVIRGYCRH